MERGTGGTGQISSQAVSPQAAGLWLQTKVEKTAAFAKGSVSPHVKSTYK